MLLINKNIIYDMSDYVYIQKQINVFFTSKRLLVGAYMDVGRLII